jgi:Protein of unknown function (DUF3309)
MTGSFEFLDNTRLASLPLALSVKTLSSLIPFSWRSVFWSSVLTLTYPTRCPAYSAVCASEQTTFGVADTLIAYSRAGVSALAHACACPRSGSGEQREQVMSLGTILLIVLILMLVGVLPTWPHARS